MLSGLAEETWQTVAPKVGPQLVSPSIFGTNWCHFREKSECAINMISAALNRSVRRLQIYKSKEGV